MSTTYALLVGINDYPDGVGTPKLSGCVNDVDLFHAHLKQGAGNGKLAVEMLRDGEATRDNVIDQFRKHLGRAKAGDVAVFQYCGHGGQSTSAKAFREFYPGGLDEGLICIDSRRPGGGGLDLADKELAVLIDEVARNGAHVAFILDSCHSGSGTRSADAFNGLRPRLARRSDDPERALDTYLDGHYAKRLKKGDGWGIPTGRHILLAACDRTQLANESPATHRGVFSTTLLEVLEKSGGNLSYADLFVRCRAAVRARADEQDPQFDVVGGFNPWVGFLGRAGGTEARRYRVTFEKQAWKINCGAMDGVPTDADKNVGVQLFDENDPSTAVGTARTVEVGAASSLVELLDFKGDEAAGYSAAITHLPVAPLLLHCPAGSAQRGALEETLAKDASVGAALTDKPTGARYGLAVERGKLQLTQRETGTLIKQAAITASNAEAVAKAMLEDVKKVARWERSLALQNHSSQIDPDLIDLACSEPVKGKPDFIHEGDEVTLESVLRGDEWVPVKARLMVRNRTGKTMHMMVAHFSPDYGISILSNDPIESGEHWVKLWGGVDNQVFFLEDGKESVERLQLIVSTQPIDGFLFVQSGVSAPSTRGAGEPPRSKKARQDDWLTRNLTVRVVPRQAQVGAKSWTSDNGVIVVKGHPKVKASLSLSTARTGTRAAGEGAPFLDAFARAGLVPMTVSSKTRGTASDDGSGAASTPNVLELNDILNPESLAEQPLEIEINAALAEDECILPFVFDGKHVMLGGDAYKDDEGRTQISIDHLHELPNYRRSLGGSLKMYFFKTYLKQTNVNKLRWVEYTADGKFEYQKDGLAAKVAAAKRVLLMVHGIIGDTEGMAQGLRECGLDSKFDLVLTYDYENLSTPIEETARTLKAELAAIGLRDGDDKHLTLLVHSMGGLVSRWFIEREGGNRLVDHLVMCGTPNNGSPFGKVEDARKIINVLTGLAANFVPALLPFSAPLLFLMNRSKKVTPTLMQMDSESAFIQQLNASADPGILYTILAGDVEAYEEPSDALFAKLLTKTGQSALFDVLFSQKANDIAVSIESITRVGGAPARARTPQTQQVACHHLNYFISQAGQAALGKVSW
ncbi:MAG: hypothetical protein AD742_04125 [Methylibium sp. NZG]|nr:MAG: hypothetical protein AD742_04125 [Methylibium sp. NZG]